MQRCNVFQQEELKYLACAIEYAVMVSYQFNVLSTLEGPIELWNTLSYETLKSGKECIVEHLW